MHTYIQMLLNHKPFLSSRCLVFFLIIVVITIDIFSAVWKIIKGWLDAEQAKKTYFVSRSNIQEYVDAAQLEPHMLKEEKKK